MQMDDDAMVFEKTSRTNVADGFPILGYISWSIYQEIMEHNPELEHRIAYAARWLKLNDVWNKGNL